MTEDWLDVFAHLPRGAHVTIKFNPPLDEDDGHSVEAIDWSPGEEGS